MVDGDRVIRPRAGAFVHDLLDYFAEIEWCGAPRLLATTEDRETLTHISGYTDPPTLTDAALIAAARLVREFHDATAGHPLSGTDEVVCHNDLAPKNTVYRDDAHPIAFIDWDWAAPGRRIDDLAHMCWQFLNLGPTVTDTHEAGRQMGLICAAYGIAIEPPELIDRILWWQDRCVRGIESDAAQTTVGVPDWIRRASGWVVEARGVLAGAMWEYSHQ
ncbi:phosphotransferase family protein [Nocardia panacis]|uniref:phosphotransferase family protein n=1 Tax=Nocardia panacis TaxID=2340916 RepID=UPI00193987E4|nr:phosphotransferase [Nocardia panacis]